MTRADGAPGRPGLSTSNVVPHGPRIPAGHRPDSSVRSFTTILISSLLAMALLENLAFGPGRHRLTMTVKPNCVWRATHAISSWLTSPAI